MPRRARLSIAGIPWHIIQRGNNRSACFFMEDDYRYYLRNLHELSRQHGCAIHAYVLMTNHVHLLVTPQHTDSASLLMKHLGQRYVQYINRTYHRSGTLWEGRFRSCLAQDDTYVLTCYRYIEMNPVRACMVVEPSQYPWSSYRFNALGDADASLTPHPLYWELGADAMARQAAYRELFGVRLDRQSMDTIRHATNGNFALGNEGFKAEIEAMLGRRARPAHAGRPRGGKSAGRTDST